MKSSQISNYFPEHKEYLDQKHPIRAIIAKDPSGRSLVQLLKNICETKDGLKQKDVEKLAKKVCKTLEKASKKKGDFVLDAEVKAEFKKFKKIYDSRNKKVDSEKKDKNSSTPADAAPKVSNPIADAFKVLSEASSGVAKSLSNSKKNNVEDALKKFAVACSGISESLSSNEEVPAESEKQADAPSNSEQQVIIEVVPS